MWRRFVLLLLLVSWALLMSWSGSSLPRVNIKGITSAGVAMQFAHSRADVDEIVAPDGLGNSSTNATLLRQQYLDFIFIGLYWAFFMALASPLCLSDRKGWRLLGQAARICISIAALSDLAENFAIVSCIGPFGLPHFWPFGFAVAKWTLFFATLGLIAPGLVFYGRLVPLLIQRPPRIAVLARIAAVFFAAAALCGIIGVVGRVFGSGQFLSPGFLLMAAGFLPLIEVLRWDAVNQPPPSDVAANFKTILTEELREVIGNDVAQSASDRDPELHLGDSGPKPLPARGRAGRPPWQMVPGPGTAIQQAGRSDLLGLAFSGGGIRSATFNLGVLQGLAELKLLRRVHYLSTVSGGGYIGAWLVAWIFRRGAKEVEERLAAPRADQPNFKEPPEIRFLREYSNYLTPRTGLLGVDTWTAIAIYLRNLLLNQTVLILFLAAALVVPRIVVVGAQRGVPWFQCPGSAGSAFLVALAIMAVITIARNMAYYSNSLPDRVIARVTKDAADEENASGSENAADGRNTAEAGYEVEWLLALGDKDNKEEKERLLSRISRLEIWDSKLVFRRSMGQVIRLHDYDYEKRTLKTDAKVDGVREGDLVISVDSWTTRSVGIFSLATLHIFLGVSFLTWLVVQEKLATSFTNPEWAIGGAVLSAAARVFGVVVAHFSVVRKVRGWRERIKDGFCKVLCCACAGALGGILFRQVACLMESWLCYPGGEWMVVGFGVPLVTMVFLIYSFVQTGLLNILVKGPAREWVARLEAWLLILAFAWASIFALAGFAPLFTLWLTGFHFSAWTSLLTWAGATLAGILGGNSARTSASGPGSTIKDKLLGLTPYVFALGLLILVSVGVNQVISPLPETVESKGSDQVSVQMNQSAGDQVSVQVQAVIRKESRPSVPFAPYWKTFMGASAGCVLLVFGICFAGSLLLAWRIDLNEFSMHDFYRNRLARCYLGASYRERVPNPFTGLDTRDDILLADLVSEKGYDGPYPILGCALNLVHGKDLAWQERKAASFIMTPRYCGYDVWFEKLLRPGQSAKRGQASDGYRPTSEYAYPDGGLYLGTAMAISGAAVSPNMGYHSSPALSFLMTIFNVRLGQWMGNPRNPRCWRRATPRLGLGYLLSELFGLTDDDSGYVYLSDGGHFENLGINELVKRRCRLILAIDAGEDKGFGFDDLASAIRKCRADMGIDIEIRTDKFLKADSTLFSGWHCAIGLIRYSNSDPRLANLPPVPENDVCDGVLVYIKPSLTGDEPADVLNYKNNHNEFPHEPTVDEWFSESQFESYRALGQHVTRTLFHNFGREKDRHPDLSGFEIDKLAERLVREWKNPEQVAVRHSAPDFF